MKKNSAWITAIPAAELSEGDVIGVEIEGQKIAIYLVNGQVYATDNICSHQFALLSDGFLEEHCIECPLHQAQFDIQTGKALNAPATKDIQTYPARIEDGQVQVNLS